MNKLQWNDDKRLAADGSEPPRTLPPIQSSLAFMRAPLLILMSSSPTLGRHGKGILDAPAVSMSGNAILRKSRIAAKLAMHHEQSRDWPRALEHLLHAAENAATHIPPATKRSTTAAGSAGDAAQEPYDIREPQYRQSM